MTSALAKPRPSRYSRTMFSLLFVMAGGAIGAGARFLVGRVMLAAMGPGYPWGTLAVNLAGGLLMGLLAGVLARHAAGGEGARLFFGVGILGGFTTFSAFGLETTNMLLRGDFLTALGYAVLSVVGTVALLFLGLQAARALA